MSILFNWPRGSISTTRQIGTTHQIQEDGTPIASATASAAGIQFSEANIGAGTWSVSASATVLQTIFTRATTNFVCLGLNCGTDVLRE